MDKINELNEIDKSAKLIRAFLQGLAYHNNEKSTMESLDNAFHYSEEARYISLVIDRLKNRKIKKRISMYKGEK